MYQTKLWSGLAVAVLLGLVGPTQAQNRQSSSNAPSKLLGYGACISVGGGFLGFADKDMRDFASLGGGWDARFVLGTRRSYAVEAAYTGGANRLDALGLDDNATLLSTGFEVLARANFADAAWQPYVVVGLGWRHYSIVNSDTNTSSVGEGEDIGEVPLGGGMAYRRKGFVIDARALFRAAFNDELVEGRVGREEARLHSWQTQLTAGYEF